MDDILYLAHVTMSDIQGDHLEVSGSAATQFPGVYFSVITVHNREKEVLHMGDRVLLFSKELLVSTDRYHLNLQDNNGGICEGNTFLPERLTEYLAALKRIATGEDKMHLCMNEVIFHDRVPMEFCRKRIRRPFGRPNREFLPSAL